MYFRKDTQPQMISEFYGHLFFWAFSFSFPSRECAMKFNDYFEFPREFDLEPYTVEGLAKLEGE